MDELEKTLSSIGFSQYLDAFVQNDIDMSLIGDLTLDELKEIGIASLGHRKKILAGLKEAAETYDPTVTAHTSTNLESSSDAERRDVTTIFADLSSYTQLSRELDKEDLHDVLSCLFDRFNEIVIRMGGTVERHIGDCVMAVFGAPVSFGNDSERALRTSVEMHRAMEDISRRFGRELTVHIGAAAGNVLFSKRGYGQRKDQDFTLTGDTVNLASRLADQAGPKETLIDDKIFLSLSQSIHCDAPVSLQVKGYESPVLAHRFVGFGKAVAQNKIVGRDREVELLGRALDGTISRRTGETLYLRGDAGIGKTRLVQETLLKAKAKGFDRHSALFLDFGLGDAESPVNKIISSMCGLGEHARESAVMSVIKRLTEADVLNEISTLFMVQILGVKPDHEMSVMLGAMSDTARVEGLHETIRRVVRHFSAQTPQLIVLEDVHWADPKMLPMINILVDESQANPVFLLLTSRMEGYVMDMDIAPIESSARVRRMTLGALKSADAMELAQMTIRVTNQMVDECIEKAQGNPLFLVQMLAHANDVDGLVPSSIQSLIQARFDRLAPQDKKILHAAAVLGQRFTMSAVTQIAEVSVYDERPLLDAALIKPVDDGYLFAHALIRDAILSTILRKDLRALHLAAANWFAKRDVVLYAQHLSFAEDPRAADAFLSAARDARDAFQSDDALDFAQKGLNCDPDPNTRGALLRVKGDVLRESGDSEKSITCFREAQDCAAHALDKCRSLIGIAAAMRILDRIDEAYAVLDEAQTIAEGGTLLSELSNVHYLRGSLHFPRGDLDGCQEEHSKSLEYAQRADLPERQALALSGLGDAAYARGRMFTAHEVIENCLQLCEQHGLGAVKSANLFMLATTKIYMNQTEQALACALQSAELAQKLGTHRPEIVSRLTAGWILTSMARYAEARSEIDRGNKLAERIAAKRFLPFLEETLARIEFEQGNDIEAERLAEAALTKVREMALDTFIGPWVMSTVALTTSNAARRVEILREGEALLAKGCVGHNYFRFYRNAMQACLNAEAFEDAERLAAALEDYTADEPTPWSQYHIQRTRALTNKARGMPDNDALTSLRTTAEAASLFNAMPVIRKKPYQTAAS
ncbi:adenylate/guanylate cyclase domain-containing protein [Ruegeria profundi]|uniref:adenylate/guanylate cyclase domain-containing protein n=1 Tax=Ruegeria profundi TaxID=1685378 RepID=UPI001CD6502B|nr:adenylate/guanylate cyclase domain-containing protein [Ruegeria profundi]MCA0927097.1 AAA family ATPase [Ruegeria profundi]